MRPGLTQKITVRGQGRTEVEPLNCVDPDSFYITWEINSTWSLQFTAYQDGSLGYSMLDSQASVFFDGQEYIIKQAEPDANSGQNSLDIVATHVYFEIGRIRKYKTYVDPQDNDKQTDVRVNGGTQIDNDDSSDDTDPNAQKTSSQSKNGDTTTTTTVTKTDETKEDSDENQISYKIEDVLKYWLDGNTLGFSYQVIGNFPSSRIEQLSDGSGTDMLSKITEHWPNAVIYPDNKVIRVYSQDQFNKDYGNRLDYLYNTTEFKWTFDSTSLTNEVMCIGGKYSIETEVDTDTGSDDQATSITKNAQGVIDDARSYLGIPYVYGGAGGARGGNPRNGMDCSSYVSQVYQDFGIHIPAQTVAMEPYFHEVSSPQTGDVGFYGAHGNSYHICLFLDANTIIFEPQPGEVCKEEPASWFYPSWVARNDQMSSIVGSGGSAGGSDNQSSSTSSSIEYYYFAPFMYRDEESIKKYGEFPAEPIEDGRFSDKNAMIEYAKTKIQPNPALSVEVTTYTSFKPIAGDMIHIMVRDQQISTNEAVVGFNWYPFSASNPTSVTLNTNTQNILDYQNARNRSLIEAINSIKQSPSYPDQSTNILTITREEANRIEQYVEQQNKQNQQEENS
ncbi:phage tail protein [Limosilactobacillus sp. STM2_1]|uniref:Phage tail protein n=1 Tax=Limosilactobacillus rudii TaxID=2759755 RepID=A0A7W3YN90_9LACO|nr:phage tail protein [Limosilactobacillus rudii]MBB1079073.1 phage tail protein [Limosilactobacillus rudii]MBB1097052.1 phage tail protein [Limosilactobacillus rudii]MCD7134020.1 phage tail protein [Limosilactobacillus rudii]